MGGLKGIVFFLHVPSRTTHRSRELFSSDARLIIQSNEAIDPLRWSVDGAVSTGDVQWSGNPAGFCPTSFPCTPSCVSFCVRA